MSLSHYDSWLLQGSGADTMSDAEYLEGRKWKQIGTNKHGEPVWCLKVFGGPAKIMEEEDAAEWQRERDQEKHDIYMARMEAYDRDDYPYSP